MTVFTIMLYGRECFLYNVVRIASKSKMVLRLFVTIHSILAYSVMQESTLATARKYLLKDIIKDEHDFSCLVLDPFHSFYKKHHHHQK